MVWQGRLKWLLIPVLVLLISFVMIYRQPDVLISTKVDLVAMRDEQGALWFSTGRKERYTAENWLRRNGQNLREKKVWSREGRVEGLPLTCDSYGCRGEIQGQKISLAYTNKAWQEDCAWADVVISKTPVPYKECAAPIVIDYFDVWRDGAHAIWLSPHKVKVQNVEELRGKRLWTQTSANKK